MAHEVFTPDETELAQARAVLAAFDQAAADGSSVALDPSGRMIDLAVVRSARMTVAAAENASALLDGA